MAWGIAGVAPDTGERFGRACADMTAGVTDGRIEMTVRLRRFGDVVADERLASGSPGIVDASGALDGLDDDELSEWWSAGCWVRTAVLAAADKGNVAACDWIVLMAYYADLGGAPEFAGLLRRDQFAMVELIEMMGTAVGDIGCDAPPARSVASAGPSADDSIVADPAMHWSRRTPTT